MKASFSKISSISFRLRSLSEYPTHFKIFGRNGWNGRRWMGTSWPDEELKEKFSKYKAIDLENRRKEVHVRWDDSIMSKYHYLWLRDNCNCSQCLTPQGQKTRNAGDVPSDIDVEEMFIEPFEKHGALRIKWNDGHRSLFDLKWLRDNCYTHAKTNEHHFLPIPHPWKAADLGSIPQIKYQELSKEEGLWKWLHILYMHGVCAVVDVPVLKGQVTSVAERISYIRHTMYGKIWNVESKPDEKVNVAYTANPIELHTDLMYYEAPPGLQFLHCLKNKATGGENTFVDGFMIAQDMRKYDPEAFQALCELPTTFHKHGSDHWLYYRRPTFSLNENKQVVAVNYSPPFEGPLKVSPKNVERYYMARKSLWNFLKKEEYGLRSRFEPGMLIAFNNRRVLHARDAFDAKSGARLLQGVYIDQDEFFGAYRILREKYLPSE